jgi:tetratricopeptide (TPR) repeat protein
MTIRAALRRFRTPSGLNLQLGMFLAAEERYDEARDAFAAAVEADCTSSEAHRHLALAEAARGNVTAAFESFRRAFELCPEDLLVARELAMAVRAAKESGDGVVIRLPELSEPSNGSQIRQLAFYLAKEADSLDAFVSLPTSEQDPELFGMLLGVVKMALDEHPRYADLHYHCSRILERLGRIEDAVRHARISVEINPAYAQALIQLGELSFSLGRRDEAVSSLERAIACGADWPDIHCRLGEIMVRSNLEARARKHLTRAVALKGNYPRATEALASLAA